MTDALIDQVMPSLGENGVLGLGEPTHGSANAFAWKLELIHELARRGLLAALAFEESFTVGAEVDAVLREGGDIDHAWSQGSSIWRTETILEGLRALQRISARLPAARRPRFLGVDISKPDRTARALRSRGHDAPSLRAIAERMPVSPAEAAELDSLCRAVEEGRDPTSAALARNLRRYADAYLAAPDLSRLHRRDTHMAQTLLEHLPARGITVLWAHNEHLARNPEGWGGPTMGQVLHEALGERYHPVGVLCGDGDCRAVDPSTGSDDYAAVRLPPLRAGTTDAALRELGRSFVTGEEFSHPGPRRFIGWRIDTSLFADARALADTFEVARPSTDFAALAYLPGSRADVGARLEPPTSPTNPTSPTSS